MYIIIELQTTDGQTANIVSTRNTKDEAMSTYHSILAAAAISQVEYHTAVVMDEEGKYLARECYRHYKQPEVVEEIETEIEGE